MELHRTLYYRFYAAVPALLAAFLSSDALGADIRSAYYDGARATSLWWKLRIAERFRTTTSHCSGESVGATKTSPTASSQD